MKKFLLCALIAASAIASHAAGFIFTNDLTVAVNVSLYRTNGTINGYAIGSTNFGYNIQPGAKTNLGDYHNLTNSAGTVQTEGVALWATNVTSTSALLTPFATLMANTAGGYASYVVSNYTKVASVSALTGSQNNGTTPSGQGSTTIPIFANSDGTISTPSNLKIVASQIAFTAVTNLFVQTNILAIVALGNNTTNLYSMNGMGVGTNVLTANPPVGATYQIDYDPGINADADGAAKLMLTTNGVPVSTLVDVSGSTSTSGNNYQQGVVRLTYLGSAKWLVFSGWDDSDDVQQMKFVTAVTMPTSDFSVWFAWCGGTSNDTISMRGISINRIR